MTIGLHHVERRDLTDLRPVARLPEWRLRRAVAGLTVLSINRFTASDAILTDAARRKRRRLRGLPEPIGNPRDGVAIDRRRRRAGAEARAQVAFVHRAVVAVPMQPHPV